MFPKCTLIKVLFVIGALGNPVRRRVWPAAGGLCRLPRACFLPRHQQRVQELPLAPPGADAPMEHHPPSP